MELDKNTTGRFSPLDFFPVFCVSPRRGRVFELDKARVQSLTQAAPAWCDWEVVRAGGVGTRGMGKKKKHFDRSPWRSANSMSVHLTFLMIINLTPIFCFLSHSLQIFHHILRQNYLTHIFYFLSHSLPNPSNPSPKNYLFMTALLPPYADAHFSLLLLR